MKIGLAIAKRREEIGMTQDELAKKVGVKKATISRWESGDIKNMRRDRIHAIATALGISPLSLLQEDVEDDLSAFQFHVQSERDGQTKTVPCKDTRNGYEPIAIKASELEWGEILDRLSAESRGKLEDYLDYLLWKQSQESLTSE